MQPLKIITKNTATLSLGQIGHKLISFFFNIYLARLLGASLFGEYHLINAFIGIFSFLPDFGTNLIIIREIAKNKRHQPNLIGQAVFINLMFAAFAFLLIIALFHVYGVGKMTFAAVVFAAATLVITAFRTIAISQFDANEKMQYSAGFSILNSLFSVSGAILGFTITKNLAGLFAGVFIGSTCAAAIIWLVAKSFFALPQLKFNAKKIFTIIKLGAPLGIAALASQAYSRLDTLILGQLLSTQVVGWYSSASILVFAGIQLVNVPLMAAIFPTLSRIKKRRRLFKSTIRVITLAIITWTVLAVILTQFIASWVVQVIYGSNFYPAIPVLKTLIIMVPFISLSAFLYKLLIIIGKQVLYLKINIAGALLSLTFNIILIPQFGLLGAAYAAVFTHMTLFLIYTFAVKKHLP